MEFVLDEEWAEVLQIASDVTEKFITLCEKNPVMGKATICTLIDIFAEGTGESSESVLESINNLVKSANEVNEEKSSSPDEKE